MPNECVSIVGFGVGEGGWKIIMKCTAQSNSFHNSGKVAVSLVSEEVGTGHHVTKNLKGLFTPAMQPKQYCCLDLARFRVYGKLTAHAAKSRLLTRPVSASSSLGFWTNNHVQGRIQRGVLWVLPSPPI